MSPSRFDGYEAPGALEGRGKGRCSAQEGRELLLRLEDALLERPVRGGIFQRLVALPREASDLENGCEELGRRSREAGSELRSLLDQLRPGSWLFERVLERLHETYRLSNDPAGYEAFLRERLERDPNNVPLHLVLTD